MTDMIAVHSTGSFVNITWLKRIIHFHPNRRMIPVIGDRVNEEIMRTNTKCSVILLTHHRNVI